MLIKGQCAEYLEIKNLQREHYGANDYWDGNWLRAEVKIEVPCFEACYWTSFRVEDFQKFFTDIIHLKNQTVNEITFDTLESGLYLKLKLQKTGSLICSGKTDNLSGNSLQFELILDNMILDHLANQLQVLLRKYPLIGQP